MWLMDTKGGGMTNYMKPNYKKQSHILVMIPTYNEQSNIIKLINQLVEVRNDPLSGKFDILFIDDNSPDGTGFDIDLCATRYDFISVIHRSKKDGIGSAHVAGITEAYNRGYTHLITMDADFTHPPEFIPKLLEKSGTYDVVIGGRHAKKESLEGWSIFRKFLTFIDHQFTLQLLNLPYDATSAFRVYRIDCIPHWMFLRPKSKSYPFFFELLCFLHESGISIYDVPVVLPPRAAGSSKLKFKDMVEWVLVALKQAYDIRVNRTVYLRP